jgi:hypothetical protein
MALQEEGNVTALKASVVQFCERAELMAARFSRSNEGKPEPRVH